MDHHTALYRATTMQKAKALYNVNSGEIDLDSNGCVPGDFSGVTGLCYWTPQRETADKYASWMKHKTDIADIAIVRIFVPKSFTESLEQERLYFNSSTPSDDWRKIVWAGRNSRPWPREFRDRWSKCDLILGHVLSGKHCKYMKIKDDTGINTADTLSIAVDGVQHPAMQWVFKHHRGTDGFEEDCQGKGHIFEMGSFKASTKNS
jgi:hypothetical protein